MKRSICLVWIFCSITTAIYAQIQPQPIPIGMFNVYGNNDPNNLSSATPDLFDVWQGVPTNWNGGNFPFEACNLVQHYWPIGIGSSVNSAIDWWIGYLQEVYDQGNVNGDVRLRAIVGNLYPHYNAYGETWLITFIQKLCEWEASGPQNGVIAGWYLVEEPMGSSHNYDPTVFEKMVSVIDQAEKNFRRHDRYVDISLDGAYYTPIKLQRFCRPADVVMISASTYLWMTRGDQPVYDAKYRDLAWSLNQFWSIVGPDRRVRSLSDPKVHLVLQAYDPIGHRQPTHWEMRQQMREALLPDAQLIDGKSVKPADGVWFFWWPGLTFENEGGIDDWLHGRRIAEAIELEIADLTDNAKNVQSPNSPTVSKFAFDPNVSFNPDNAIIEYDLAEVGNVQIEMRDRDGVRIELFSMGVQSRGKIRDFGGPKWKPRGDLPDDIYTFRLFIDGDLKDRVDIEMRRLASLTSPSHTIGIWSNDRTIDVEWHLPPSEIEIDGFSHLWNNFPTSVAPQIKKLNGFERSLTSDEFPDGDHYFHFRSVDQDRNWKTTSHLGPFKIDATPPDLPPHVESTTHSINEWTAKNQITVRWSPSEDHASGLAGYSLIWSRDPNTTPIDQINIGKSVTEFTTPQLLDGTWYVHIRPVDLARNFSVETTHFGPFKIDTTPPEPIADLESPSHNLSEWTNQNRISLKWRNGFDRLSGLKTHLIVWDESPSTDPDRDAPQNPENSHLSPPLSDGKFYAHVRVIDQAGMLSETTKHLGPFWIDITPPKPISNIKAYKTSQLLEEIDLNSWQNSKNTTLTWDGSDNVLKYLISQNDISETIENTIYSIQNVGDGEKTFQIQAIDLANNLSDPLKITLKIDTTVKTPAITSTSHPNESIWYSDPNPKMEWSIDHDASGISHFLGEFSDQPDTIPTKTISEISDPLPDRVNYFHIRVIDNAGNFSETAHFRVQIDREIASVPTIQSKTHSPEIWSNKTIVDLRWEHVKTPSGVANYSYILDRTADTIPDNVTENLDTPRIEKDLSEGVWYFHLKPISRTEIVGETAHFQIKIDTSNPTPKIRSSSHPESENWHGDRQVSFTIETAENLSGVRQIYAAYDQLATTTPTEKIDPILKLDDQGDPTETAIVNLPDGVWFLHVRTEDHAGNFSETDHFRVQIDSAKPRKPIVQSTTHFYKKWGNLRLADLRWNVGENLSGMDGYSFTFDTDQNAVPDEVIDTENTQIQQDLPDGEWFFFVRAKGKTGVWSDIARYEIRVDTTPPIIAIDTPNSDGWLTSEIDRFAGAIIEETSGIDPTSFEFRLGDQSWQSFENEAVGSWLDTNDIPKITEADGVPFQVRVKDRSGNLGISETINLFVDLISPTLTLTTPTHSDQDLWHSQNQATVQWQIDDLNELSGISEIFIEWNDRPESVPTISVPISQRESKKLLDDGVSYFHLMAIDRAGNRTRILHRRFMIDTEFPIGGISILKADIAPGIPKTIRYLPPSRDIPLINSGEVRIRLTVSEDLNETPKLFFDPFERSEFPIELSRKGDGWIGSFRITPEIGEGIGSFRFVGIDRAGNIGEKITTENRLQIETVVKSSVTIEQIRISADGVIISIQPNSIREDIFINLLKLENRDGYRLVATDLYDKPLDHLIFAKPITLQFPIENLINKSYTVFYNDGVTRHPIGTNNFGNAIVVQVDQIGEFWIGTGEQITKKIAGGWAAPNPFAPINGPTIFHVQIRDVDYGFTIEIFNLNGRKMRTLRNGSKIWDGKDENGDLVEGGLYIYQIRSADQVLSGTVVVIR